MEVEVLELYVRKPVLGNLDNACCDPSKRKFLAVYFMPVANDE
jgi:hypothetical protein